MSWWPRVARAGLRFGDIVTSGTYAVDVDGIARGLIDSDVLALEVATAQTFDVISCD